MTDDAREEALRLAREAGFTHEFIQEEWPIVVDALIRFVELARAPLQKRIEELEHPRVSREEWRNLSQIQHELLNGMERDLKQARARIAELEQARTRPVHLSGKFPWDKETAEAVTSLAVAAVNQHYARPGWRWVPEEPTQEMVSAYWQSPSSPSFDYNGWKALLAATPTPEDQP
jgi:hypothetical protein